MTQWTAACQASLSLTSSQKLSNHLILCHPLLLLPAIFYSISVFSNESATHIRWPKFWSFTFSISPSNEYSGLISFILFYFFFYLFCYFITDISQYIQKYRKEYNEPYVYIIQFNQFVNSWPILFSFSVSLYYFKEISDITSFYFKELFLLFSSFRSLHCDVDSDIFAYLQTCLHNCLFESCLGVRYIGMLYCIFAIFLFFNCTLFTHEDGSPNMIRFRHWRKRI